MMSLLHVSMQDGLCSLLINAKSTYFTSVSQTTWIKLRIRYMGVDSKTRFACGMFGSRVLSYSVHGKPWISHNFVVAGVQPGNPNIVSWFFFLGAVLGQTN